MENYQIPTFRRNRNSKGARKLVSVRNSLIARRIKYLETKVSETISFEFTFERKSGAFYLLIKHLNETVPQFSKKFQIA